MVRDKPLDSIPSPMGPGSARILLLGGGELGKELAVEAQRLGFEVVVVDRYQWAPAMHLAHRYYVINMMDYKAVRSIVERESPLAVIAEIEAINTEALMDLEDEGFNIVPNARAVAIAMNRIELRRLAAEKLGLPTTRYSFAESEEEAYEACEKVGYPCLLKPEMSSSGHGHVRIPKPATKRELYEAYRECIRHARGDSRRVIVEELVELEAEFTILAYRWLDGDRVRTGVVEPIEHWRYGEFHYIESWHPSERKGLYNEAWEIARRIAEALGGLGLYAVELLYTRDGRLLFSEVAPRPHDTGMVTMASLDPNEFSLHLRAGVGLPVPEVRLLTPAASYAVYTELEGEWHPILAGVYDALRIPGVQVRWFGKPVTYRGRRMAVILARAHSVEEARRKAREAARLLSIKPRGGGRGA